MSGVFDEMMKQYQDLASLREFSECQHETILQLSKKIDKLEKQKRDLEVVVKENNPNAILSAETTSSPAIALTTGEHEENICRMELKKLNDISIERILTLEEAKKTEIYTKLLLQIDSRKKPATRDVTEVNTEELLKLVSE